MTYFEAFDRSSIHSGHSAVSTCSGFGHRWGRNGEFCVTLGPVTRTARILAYCKVC